MMLLATLGLAAAIGAGAAQAADCPAVADPVVTVSHGSRYTDDSKTRSDFDAEGEAEIEAALGPIDDFIVDLANLSNRALGKAGEEKPDEATEAADCLLDAIALWAAGDALTEIDTLNAKLSIPSRVGGIAIAYANALQLASDDPARKDVIEAWLAARAAEIVAFFDGDEVPPNASRNNLRAWAGLAVTRIGLTLDDSNLVIWGTETAREMICASNPDGSLPLEMGRGPLALHYQIHAVGPLVMTAALLAPTGVSLADECDAGLSRIIDFTLAAVDDPALAASHAGEEQSFKPGAATLKPFEIAWLAPWLSLEPSDSVAKFADQFDNFSNSKLGGDLTLIWPMATD